MTSSAQKWGLILNQSILSKPPTPHREAAGKSVTTWRKCGHDQIMGSQANGVTSGFVSSVSWALDFNSTAEKAHKHPPDQKNACLEMEWLNSLR